MKITDDQKAFLEDKVTVAMNTEATPAEIVEGFVAFLEGLEPEIIDPTKVKMKYIGRREVYEHRVFGFWTKDMVKGVPTAIAAQMVKHPDVFIEAAGEVAVEDMLEPDPKDEEDRKEEEINGLRDEINQARTKQVIVDVIKQNYGQHDISTELNVKTAKMDDYRRVALAWVDRFGLDG